MVRLLNAALAIFLLVQLAFANEKASLDFLLFSLEFLLQCEMLLPVCLVRQIDVCGYRYSQYIIYIHGYIYNYVCTCADHALH